LFFYIFKKNFFGHNKIWMDTNRLGRGHCLRMHPVTMGLVATINIRMVTYLFIF